MSSIRMKIESLKDLAEKAVVRVRKQRQEHKELEERNRRRFWGCLWPVANCLVSGEIQKRENWGFQWGWYTESTATNMLRLCRHSGDGYVTVDDEDLSQLEP